MTCMDYPFTLPRRALMLAEVTWTDSRQSSVSLVLFRDGAEVADSGTAIANAAATLRLEADAGDYVLQIQPQSKGNDRYVLDASFHEVDAQLSGTFPGAAAEARSAAEASAAIAARMADVPCEASSVDALTTSENLVQLAQVEYEDDGERRGEMDARDGWLLATVFQGGGFDLINISDPEFPVHRARYLPEDGQSFDVKWMPDGQTAVVGHRQAVDLVDLSGILRGEEYAEPVLLHRWEYEPVTPNEGNSGMHMLTPARIDGIDWVFLSTQGPTVTVLKHDPATRSLSLVGRLGNDVWSGAPHDSSFVVDEATGRPLLYVANGDLGWRVFDVSDPMNPQQLAHVMLQSGSSAILGTMFTHSVVAQTVDQRRLVAVSNEGPGSFVTVYDATDWSSPNPIGTWTQSDPDPLASTHNIQIVDGLLYLAAYRAGAFVFDLHDLGSVLAPMEPIAHFQAPEPHGPDPPTVGIDYGHNIWEVIIHRGILYASDMDAGTYILGFGCLTPGDQTASSKN